MLYDFFNLIYNVRIELLHNILQYCDYTIEEWREYYISAKPYNYHTNLIIINAYIKNLIIYDQSLRNAWILSCSAI